MIYCKKKKFQPSLKVNQVYKKPTEERDHCVHQIHRANKVELLHTDISQVHPWKDSKLPLRRATQVLS